MKKRICFLCLICSILFAGLTACDTKTEEEIHLTDAQIDDLMKQYVEDAECYYEEYLPSTWVASCEIFGVEYEDENEDIAYIYAYVLDEEYVRFKEKAYLQSGGVGEAKIKVRIRGDEIQYLSNETPEDGDDYAQSLKELFPKKYYRRRKQYNPYQEDGELKLSGHQREQIKELWGVEIAEDESLDIDEDGNYELSQIYEGGPGEFDVKVIERGKLTKRKSVGEDSAN